MGLVLQHGECMRWEEKVVGACFGGKGCQIQRSGAKRRSGQRSSYGKGHVHGMGVRRTMRLKKKLQHQAAPIWLELTKTQAILGKKKKEGDCL